MADNTYEFSPDQDFATPLYLGVTPATSSPIYAGPNQDGYFGVNGGLFTLNGSPVHASHWSVRFDLHNHGASATMVGGDWGDVLIGTNFADDINGGQGNDTLEGGGGADTYRFGIGGDRDVINGFQVGVDKVYIERNGALSASNILDLIADDGNGNAILTIRPGDTITFNGVAKASLSAGDFLLENLAPTANIAFDSFVVNEQTPFSLKGYPLSISDDSSSGSMTVTLSVTTGILNLTAGTSGATVTNSGTSSVTIKGTVAQINALLLTDTTSSVDLFINSNTPPSSAVLMMSITDNGGPGGSKSAGDVAIVTIVSVNDAPSTSDSYVVTTEDTAHVFTLGSFGFSDVDGNSLLNVVIDTLPTSGTLLYDGVAITTSPASISAADVALGKLSYVPGVNVNGAGAGSFTFRVQDNGGTLNSGADLSSAHTVTIDVTAANDAPTGSDATVHAAEDTPYALTATDFGFSDIDGDDLSAVRIETLTSGGSLKLFGTDIAAGTTVAVALINAGLLTYTAPANANGTGLDSFTFKVIDDSNAANNTSAASTLTFDVAAVNDAPTITVPASIAVTEDQLAAVTGISFGDVDADTTLVVASFAVGAGEGTLSAAASAGLQIFGNDSEALALKGTIADINAFIAAGKLTYAPAANSNGNVTLGIAISDEGGTGSGGTKTANGGTTLAIAAVDDAPTAVTLTQTANAFAETADTSKPHKVADIAITDIDGGPNVLTLTGADAGLFVIKGDELFLKSGAKLDFETNARLDVTVNLDVAGGSGPIASASLSIDVTDVVEVVSGNRKNNVLVGSAASETIDGRGGDDTVKGGGGADTIIGGSGADVLKGGAGADVFVFRPGDLPTVSLAQHWLSPLSVRHDTITDFKPGTDVIDLSAIDANTHKSGNQKFHFEGEGDLSGSRGELVYQFYGTKPAAKHTIIMGDTDGDANYDVLIVLKGHHHLDAGDFIL